MSLNDVKFKVLNGGLGKKGAKADAISGLILSTTILGTPINDILKFENKSQAEVWLRDALKTSALNFNSTTNATNWKKHLHLAFIISDFYRNTPNETLFIGLSADANMDDKAQEMQLFAQGKIRNFGILTDSDYEDTTALISDALTDLDKYHTPAVCVINSPTSETSNDYISGASLLAYIETNELAGKYMAACIGANEDIGVALGFTDKFSCIGAVLSLVAMSKVSESIAWVEMRNLMTEDEGFLIPILKKEFPAKRIELSKVNLYVQPIDWNGNKMTDYTEPQLSAIQDKGYLFMRKHIGSDGTYMNEAFTLDERTSDFSKLQYTRTMQKSTRELRVTLLPKLNSPIRINADNGEVAPDVIGYFESICDNTLEKMKKEDEISGYAVSVLPILEDDEVTPGQKKLVIKEQIVPFGSADVIENNIGFAVQISKE